MKAHCVFRGKPSHLFQSKSTSDSDRSRPAIPAGSCPLFGGRRNRWTRCRNRGFEGQIVTLDNRLVRSPSRWRGGNSASRKVVHAENKRSPETEVRVGFCQSADCAQLQGQPQ